MSEKMTVRITPSAHNVKIQVTGQAQTITAAASTQGKTVSTRIERQEKQISTGISVQVRSISAQIDKRPCAHTPYDGGYDFTPGDTEQIISTRGKVLFDNVRIAPIPSNYGRIAYNGHSLTVS